ncbi:MAG: efflux RND transporter permease subunit [Lachnospiraceae bacterium]|nr:efflux RND transporter permease subunit [Lachnospiraceae bacterium]
MISKFSVKRAYTIVVGIVLVLILGVVVYTRMTVDLLPSIELPYAVVMTTYPGASPESVETGVTKPIEQAVATIDNIKTIQSISSENYSMVVLEFNSDTNMDAATIDMREKLDQIKGYFDESVGNPIILKLNPNMLPVMIAAVDKEGTDIVELSEYVNNNITSQLEGIEGVASVTTMGAVEESVQVIVRKDKVKRVNEDVVKALDDKFAEAEDALADGKDKISSGKSQLESGVKTAGKEFAKAENKINTAKYELMESEKDVTKAKTELDTQEKELNSQKTQLESAITSLNELLTSYQTLSGQKEQLEMAVAMNPSDVAMQAQLETVKGALATMEQKLAEQKDAEGNALTFATLPAYITSLQGSLAQLEAGLTEIAKGKKELAKASKKITSGKSELDKGYTTLKEKESETSVEMAAAKAELAQGEKELEAQEDNLEDAKDAAYEGADLNTIITDELIKGILTAQNFDYPAGYVTEDDVDYLVRVGEKFDDVEGLSDFVLLDMNMDGVDPIKLSDVADVFIENDSDKLYTRVNGNPGIILSIAKQNEYSTKAVSDRIKKEFDKISENDSQVSFTALMDQGIYIDLVSNSVIQNLLFGALLAVSILLLFLKDIRPTGIIAVSIPVSVIFAVVLMYFSGVTLNVISLSGLALGVGMLVDNSIVVIENIYRLRSEGHSVREAAIKGANQMVGAITASTLTTVCVFLPIVFTSGITKQLFTDMGLTIAYSLFASLIVAITFVPMVASKTFSKISEKENKLVSRISNWYAGILPGILNHKIIVLLLALVLFVGMTVVEIGRGFSFFPDMDSPQMEMTLTMPEETKTLEETAEVSDKIINAVSEIDDIETVGAILGGSGLSLVGLGSNDNISTVSYFIECKEDKKHTNEEIADMIREKTKDFPGELDVQASSIDMSALSATGIVIQVKGKELDKIEEIAQQVGEKLTEVKGLTDIENGLEESTPEYRMVVDKTKAASYGLTVAQVYQEVQKKLADSTTATTLTTDTKDYPVYVKLEDSETYNLKDIENIELDGKQGEEEKKVKVSRLADVKDASSLSSINRLDQVRYITVTAQVKNGYTTTAVSNEVTRLVNSMSLPSGYSISYDGENETVMEALEQVMLMMVLAIAFMYLIMVAQFQSLKSPFIILFTLPLAFTGGFAALFLAGKDVSIIAMIGMVMLAGIIVNNGIVFVDSVNQLREDEGKLIREAIVITGRNRLRPIVMTALTTILGLSTLAAGIGMGADMAQPMALVVIGGLIYGTLLTLIVVPCIYELFNRDRNIDRKDDASEIVDGPEEVAVHGDLELVDVTKVEDEK